MVLGLLCVLVVLHSSFLTHPHKMKSHGGRSGECGGGGGHSTNDVDPCLSSCSHTRFNKSRTAIALCSLLHPPCSNYLVDPFPESWFPGVQCISGWRCCLQATVHKRTIPSDSSTDITSWMRLPISQILGSFLLAAQARLSCSV